MFYRAIAPSWLFDGARKTNTLVTSRSCFQSDARSRRSALRHLAEEFLVEKTLELFGDSKSKLAGQQLCFTAKEFGVSLPM